MDGQVDAWMWVWMGGQTDIGMDVRWTDGWMYGQLDGWTWEWMGGETDVAVNADGQVEWWMDEWKYVWMGGQTGGMMDGQVDGWTGGWMTSQGPSTPRVYWSPAVLRGSTGNVTLARLIPRVVGMDRLSWDNLAEAHDLEKLQKVLGQGRPVLSCRDPQACLQEDCPCGRHFGRPREPSVA